MGGLCSSATNANGGDISSATLIEQAPMLTLEDFSQD